jgi:hypothetical protein
MDQQKSVRVLTNRQLKGVTRIKIQETEDLGSFIDRAANLLWKGSKFGKRLFYDNGDEALELESIVSGDTLYISEGEDWIGMIQICCFPLPY